MPMAVEVAVAGSLPQGAKVKVNVVMSGFGKIDEPVSGFVQRFDKDGSVLLEKEGWKADRNWNWKDPNFRYSPGRAASNPDYIGSYCMDNLAMALHCVWSTSTFSECLLKVVNMCGDSDTVAAVAGQIAGAIYGVSAVPAIWRELLERWDGGDVAFKAWLLYNGDNEELLSRAVRVMRPDTQERLKVKACFEKLNLNEDGRLTREGVLQMLSKSNDKWSEMVTSQLFAAADSNLDSTIGSPEFLNFMISNPRDREGICSLLGPFD
mmetsp:Transcript_84615/g.248120  ORF Transcript_84615/g.248120 Transcript_84615/m.248120 type:complete len:265 (-) Transcript_84615:17-811(-)